MLSNIGWIGSFLLGICGIFEVFRSFKSKKCFLGWGFLTFWGLGEILLLIYVVPKFDYPLIVNYAANVVFASILIFYKIRS